MKRKSYYISALFQPSDKSGQVGYSFERHAWNSSLSCCVSFLGTLEGVWSETAKSFFKDGSSHVGGCWHWVNTKGDKVFFQITKYN